MIRVGGVRDRYLFNQQSRDLYQTCICIFQLDLRYRKIQECDCQAKENTYEQKRTSINIGRTLQNWPAQRYQYQMRSFQSIWQVIASRGCEFKAIGQKHAWNGPRFSCVAMCCDRKCRN